MKKTALWTIAILVLIFGGIYFVEHDDKSAQTTTFPKTTGTVSTNAAPGTTTQGPIVIDYYCTEGTIVASYASNTAAISLSDGRTFTLPQTVSGSGVRYEQGAIAFITKGNNAYLQESGTTTYDNCVAGTQTQNGTTNTFTDGSKLFSFSYPSGFTISGEIGYSTDWMTNTETNGLKLVEVDIPQSFEPMTNFASSKFTVGTSSDPAAISTCLTAENGEKNAGTVTINGVMYTKITDNDAGAGNFYDTTSYRTINNNQCYAVEYTIHSSDIGNYSPDQHITAFDQAKVQAAFEGMAQSFKFL